MIAVEGDSIDGTPNLLKTWAAGDSRLTVITRNTGLQRFGHEVTPQRFAHLASIFNTGLNAVDCLWSDYIIFTPSDIIFTPDVLKRLIAQGKRFIAPMYWTNENGHSRFYDTWGFTRGGVQFRPLPKAWYKAHFPHAPFEVDTVGGLVLIDADLVAAGARYGNENVDRGLCQSIKELGATVWADPTTHIYHR